MPSKSMPSTSDVAAERQAAPSEPTAGRRVGLMIFEVAWIFLIFFLFAASVPPDVGESHYLAKAKHYWQPDWCAGDLFLESRDAHAVFNWTFGWVTLFASLPMTAWIGRVATWGLLAWSWQRLSYAAVSRPLMSILSASLMLLFLRNFHLAGEWIVGGVEAKGFAYVLVFLALEAIVRGKWQRALLFAGGAGAFHVLVGGWTAVAIGLSWLVAACGRPPLRTLLPAAALGLVLALPGLVPALLLNYGVERETSLEAARIYVFERLSHHLVYHRLPPHHAPRFAILVAGWLLLAWLTRRESRLWRLHLVAAGAVLLTIVGVAIDQSLVWWANRTGQSASEYELAAAPLLRYYWFRLGDALVPIGVALAICYCLGKLWETRPPLASWLTGFAVLLAGANLADVCYWRMQQRLPPAILQPRPTPDSRARWWFSSPPRPTRRPPVATWYSDWLAVCDWIEHETPPDAKFLTPRNQQTFKWYAGRAEVATWKDVPQDAEGLVHWKQVLLEIHPPRWRHQVHDLAAFSDAELVRLAKRHGATHVLIDRSRGKRPTGLTRVYPTIREENATFAVYQVPADP